jgi:hypothetical protein
LLSSSRIRKSPASTSISGISNNAANSGCQKGDTITLRQPSFAEGREDVGSFGFINLRKPGAWTRLKPGQNSANSSDGDSPKKSSKHKRMSA